MPLCRASNKIWRTYLHGECGDAPVMDGVPTGMQYIVGERRKYIYYPGPGVEQFFDLANDPNEMIERSRDANYREEILQYRKLLIEEIWNRPEGFVQNGKLVDFGTVSPAVIPGFESSATDPI